MGKNKIQQFVYYQNPLRNNTFDISEECTNLKPPFKFLTFNEPREDYLLKKKVTVVMQSFKGNQKILHTGLIPFGTNLYYGDYLERNGKKHFLIVSHDEVNEKIYLFIFIGRNPRNKEKFATHFAIENLIKKKF